jgi:hypothetical protein
MLNEDTMELLKHSIVTIQHDKRGAFLQTDLVEKLAKALSAWLPDEDENDPDVWTRMAKIIVKEAMHDDGTPANGMLHFPGFEPFPYTPDQLLSDSNGYLIQFANATPEFTQHAAELAQAEARIAQAEVAQAEARIASAYNN